MIRKVVDDVLRRLCREDLTPEQLSRIENVMFIVLNNYDVTSKTTDLQCVNNGWQRYLDYFLDRKLIAGKSEKTVELYRFHLTHALTAINKDLDDITEIDLVIYLEMYRQNRNVKNAYLDGIRMCLRNFFGFLYQKELIKKDPACGMDKIKVPKEIKHPFSDEELEKLRRECRTARDKAIIEFLYSTGVRISEMCGLNIDDVDFEHGEAVVMGKGSKERTVFLSKICMMYLKEYLEERTDGNPALFVTLRQPNRRITCPGVQKFMRTLGAMAGVDDCHPHRFRRTMATNLLRKGMPIEEVQVVLGHEKIETTLIYTSVTKDSVKSHHKQYMTA